MMHGCGKSDFAIIAEKPANKTEQSAAESVEPRAETKGSANQQSTLGGTPIFEVLAESWKVFPKCRLAIRRLALQRPQF